MSEEFELNLSLDSNCRTKCDSTSSTENTTIDYSSKTVLTSLADDSEVKITKSCPSSSSASASVSSLEEMGDEEKLKLLDDLLFDCEITDCALLPRTFWMPCDMEPRCSLEKCAMEVFNHHIKKDHVYDPTTSGIEWWVQIRPSPAGGRYKVLFQDQVKVEDGFDKSSSDYARKENEDKDRKSCTKENEDSIQKGICFHWDKDEDLRLLMGGNMYIHPHISTVTYLSDIGAPTMALNYRINPLTGEYIIPPTDEVVEGYISWPKKGKHLSFDGRFLHAAPSDFMRKGLFEQQIKVPLCIETDSDASGNRKVIERRYRRVTFLVNIWLNYKPFNVDVFPESMIDKLSKSDQVSHVLFKNNEQNHTEENKTCAVRNHRYDKAQSSEQYHDFQWSMGCDDDKNEKIEMKVPLEIIHNEIGGNVNVSWSSDKDSRDGIKLTQIELNSNSNCNKKQRVE